MDADRRFTEDEVAEILDRATDIRDGGGSPGGPAGGLTLRELHEIGREVGIPEEAITRAASGLHQPVPSASPPVTFLGQRIGVERTVELPRRLTDHEWHRLVADLREIFDAKGKVQVEGAFRQWTNSNLQVMLEPTETGERLRLRTKKGNARPFQTVGGTFMALGGISAFLGTGDPRDALLFLVMGAGFFLGSRLTIPGWKKTRAAQFEAIGDRVASWTAGPDEVGAGRRPALPDGESEAL